MELCVISFANSYAIWNVRKKHDTCINLWFDYLDLIRYRYNFGNYVFQILKLRYNDNTYHGHCEKEKNVGCWLKN